MHWPSVPTLPALGPAALVAYTAATTTAEAATALFYLAVGDGDGGDQEQARDLIRQARAADPAQVPAWINELAEIGQHHHGVLQLIPALTAPIRPARPPQEDTPMTAPTDLVVVLPGILGSTLRQDGRLVWAPSAGSALRAIATFGASVRRLELPAGIGDDHPCDGVEPAGLMPDLHVLPGIWTAGQGL